MKKQIIYITSADKNWLKGLEYFIDEWQLNYRIIQYTNVENILLRAEEIKNNILVVILDWELSENGYFKQEAYNVLEKAFSFVPVIALSEFEFSGLHPNSFFINKKINDPEEIFNTIMTFVNFYNNDWINNKINRISYSVETFTSLQNPVKNIQEKSFYDPNPLVARQQAINYFKTSSKAFQIKLYGFTTVPELEDILPCPSIAGMVIYSDFLLNREIIANLNAEYSLFKLNGFLNKGNDQVIQLAGSLKPFNVLKDIVNEKGETLLR